MSSAGIRKKIPASFRCRSLFQPCMAVVLPSRGEVGGLLIFSMSTDDCCAFFSSFRKSTKSRLASGQGNTRCDLGESRSWYDVDKHRPTTVSKILVERKKRAENLPNHMHQLTFFLSHSKQKRELFRPVGETLLKIESTKKAL